ncbi:MAG: pilus assembly protein [Chloroflexi bacterium]|nr:MAG: pilus assembly protein [Chloroflexota bacterium]
MKRLLACARSQRSQGLTEFALIAPVILLLTFGIIDFGRALYIYITLQQAANEGARVAVRASYFIDPNGASHNWPPSNTGWVFITDPSAAGNATPNAPRGQLPYNPPPAGCNDAVAADGNQPLKVTLWYTFQPITPVIQQVIGNNIVITAYAVYRAEYSN